MMGENGMTLNIATVQTAIEYWLNNAVLRSETCVKSVAWNEREMTFKVQLQSRAGQPEDVARSSQ